MKTGFDALSAYNIFLEIAVESGIFALIAFVGFLITLVKNAINFILKSNDAKAVIIVSSAIISIVAVCIHGMVDTVFFRPPRFTVPTSIFPSRNAFSPRSRCNLLRINKSSIISGVASIPSIWSLCSIRTRRDKYSRLLLKPIGFPLYSLIILAL